MPTLPRWIRVVQAKREQLRGFRGHSVEESHDLGQRGGNTEGVDAGLRRTGQVGTGSRPSLHPRGGRPDGNGTRW